MTSGGGVSVAVTLALTSPAAGAPLLRARSGILDMQQVGLMSFSSGAAVPTAGGQGAGS